MFAEIVERRSRSHLPMWAERVEVKQGQTESSGTTTRLWFYYLSKAETSSHIFIIVVAEKKRFSKQRTIDKEQGTIKELFSTLNTVTRLKKCTIFATTIVFFIFYNFEMVVKDFLM